MTATLILVVDRAWALCSLYNNIVTPARLVSGSDFSLFKAGIEPKWEDAANQYGGKWTFLLPKGTSKNQLDQYWLNLVRSLPTPPRVQHTGRPRFRPARLSREAVLLVHSTWSGVSCRSRFSSHMPLWNHHSGILR